jgi:hypothetical protein
VRQNGVVEALLERLRQDPGAIEFEQVMAVIAEHYHYTPCAFRNGRADDCVENPAGGNQGSCKIFAFAQLHALDADQTLACFGRYYRDDVLKHPDRRDHANIRSFMRHGPAGISFDGTPLKRRG